MGRELENEQMSKWEEAPFENPGRLNPFFGSSDFNGTIISLTSDNRKSISKCEDDLSMSQFVNERG